MAATKLMDTAVVFMDASITTGNPVYRGSYGEVTFNDSFTNLPAAGSGQTVNCWMIDHEISTGTTVTSCNNASGNVITISNLKQNAAGKQFKFRVLASFAATQSSTISQAITKVTAGETIDDKSALLTVTRGNGFTKGTAPLVGVGGYDGTPATPGLIAGSDQALASNVSALQVAQTLSLATTSTSVVTISLPLTHTNPGADN
jgi:hypothetical protein